MKGNLRMIEDTDKENSSGLMVEYMKEDGRQESNMEKVYLLAKKVRKSMVSGKMEKGLNG